MKLSCIFGHKWNGCTCERCGEVRNEGHEYANYMPNGEKCIGHCKCGKQQALEHDWQSQPDSCIHKCARCGKTSEPQHQWQRVDRKCEMVCACCGEKKSLDHQWTHISGKCVEVCGVCGKENGDWTAKHTWQRVEGKCVKVCSVCGKEDGAWNAIHTWERLPGKCASVCTVCGREKAPLPEDHSWEYVEGTCTEKCAVCGETREKHNFVNGKCSRCGQQSPEAFMDDCVEKLLAIFPTAPLDYEGHRRFDAAHREEVRRIGEQLDQLGGMRVMRRVGEAFAQRRPIHARKLETTWNGIGNWMG